MDKLSCCRNCNRYINQEYPYCPWCGAHQSVEADWKETIDNSSRKMEVILKDRNLKQIEANLDQMEEDLNQFMERENKKF